MALEQAKTLPLGVILYHVYLKNADGSPQRWRVNGKATTWVRKPEKVRVLIKRGLYEYGYLTQDIVQDFYFSENGAKQAFELLVQERS